MVRVARHVSDDVTVPVVSRDELNHIARHTNTMIDGLREKERVKGAFGVASRPRSRGPGPDHPQAVNSTNPGQGGKWTTPNHPDQHSKHPR